MNDLLLPFIKMLAVHTDDDVCKEAGACNPSTGTCALVPKADGTPCDDGNACTQSDVCLAGACTGQNPVVCEALDQCHAVGTCNATTGVCSNPERPDGSSCQDGDACTLRDECAGGVCVGSDPVVCSSSNPCVESAACDPTNGSCTFALKSDATPCDDSKS